MPPPDWWGKYTLEMVESAEAVTYLFERMDELDLATCVYPFTGLGLFTAAGIHVFFSIFKFDSLEGLLSRERARKSLQVTMSAFNTIGHYWDLPFHWVSAMGSNVIRSMT
jgi:hypothetical protein